MRQKKGKLHLTQAATATNPSIRSESNKCFGLLSVVVCLQTIERMQYWLFVLCIYGLQVRTKTDKERCLLTLLYTALYCFSK